MGVFTFRNEPTGQELVENHPFSKLLLSFSESHLAEATSRANAGIPVCPELVQFVGTYASGMEEVAT